MIRLIKNEFVKIFKKKSFYIVMLVTLIFIVGYNKIMRNISNSENINYYGNLDEQIDYVEKDLQELDPLKESDKSQYIDYKSSLETYKLMKKYDKFMKGKNAENLDGAIRESFKQIEKINVEHQKTMIKVEESVHRINSVFQKLRIVKYNAFKEMGGNLSFALCMLDSENTGFILNTMHGREGSYTYIKEIIKGEAYATLGEEEKEALEKAMNS